MSVVNCRMADDQMSLRPCYTEINKSSFIDIEINWRDRYDVVLYITSDSVD